MTNDQLNQGNELSSRISQKRNTISSQLKALKELELTEDEFSIFDKTTTKLKLKSTECHINTKRLTEFLQKEVEINREERRELKQQFEEL